MRKNINEKIMKLNEIPDLELIKGNVKVSWCWIGEGKSGDYDPDDPTDIPLMRFDVYKYEDSDGMGSDWEEIIDSSYCTLFPVTEQERTKILALEYIMDRTYEFVIRGQSIKRLCEELSFIFPKWFQEQIEEK